MLDLTISCVQTAIINLVVFSFLPALWWFFRHRKETGFLKWIGFYKSHLNSSWWTLLLFSVLYFFFYNFDFTRLVPPETLAYIESSSAVTANVFAGLGFAAVIPALIENFIANGVAEEILYRGFLCKRLCHRFGSTAGILLQAVLFGLMHNALYALAGLDVGLWYHTLMFVFTGTGALLLGVLNEKIFNGSILPSIVLHGAGNFIASMLIAFS